MMENVIVNAPSQPPKEFFSNRALKNLIIPLFVEQLLVMLVGMADTLIVSYAGEAAVSGVSLVNQFNTVFIYLFTALASGGAVVTSQYIGRGDPDLAGESSSHLLLFSTLFSIIIAVLVLIGNQAMLTLVFGRVEDSVMQSCVTYLRISAYSYPALAIYNAGAAACRSLGKTGVTMRLSIYSNIINVVGNIIGVFVLHAGVAGVAWPSLAARVFSAVAITILCFREKYGALYHAKRIFQWNWKLIKRILGIAVPNSIESGIFQLVKVVLSSIAALFGTYQIAANGVTQSIWSLAALAGLSMGPAFITVIGQSMGGSEDSEFKQTDAYFKRLLKITVVISLAWNALVFALTPVFMLFYSLSPETKHLVILLVLLHNIFNAVAFPFSGALSSGLRAAGDARFTALVSVISTIGVRLVFSYLFAIVFGMGVMGVAWAMCLDWVARGIAMAFRLRGGKWKRFRVI
ncbi:MAG: MATE family efflux transporter [Clostridiales bacterium]|jgi:putative MATE family efflux protein|nr:MATE family efflux transporter [Clostridiales bacterium]